jgi:hypothetical protein
VKTILLRMRVNNPYSTFLLYICIVNIQKVVQGKINKMLTRAQPLNFLLANSVTRSLLLDESSSPLLVLGVCRVL